MVALELLWKYLYLWSKSRIVGLQFYYKKVMIMLSISTFQVKQEKSDYIYIVKCIFSNIWWGEARWYYQCGPIEEQLGSGLPQQRNNWKQKKAILSKLDLHVFAWGGFMYNWVNDSRHLRVTWCMQIEVWLSQRKCKKSLNYPSIVKSDSQSHYTGSQKLGYNWFGHKFSGGVANCRLINWIWL